MSLAIRVTGRPRKGAVEVLFRTVDLTEFLSPLGIQRLHHRGEALHVLHIARMPIPALLVLLTQQPLRPSGMCKSHPKSGKVHHDPMYGTSEPTEDPNETFASHSPSSSFAEVEFRFQP